MYIYIYIYIYSTLNLTEKFPTLNKYHTLQFQSAKFFHFANCLNDNSITKASYLVHGTNLNTQLSQSHKIKKCISGDGSLGL